MKRSGLQLFFVPCVASFSLTHVVLKCNRRTKSYLQNTDDEDNGESEFVAITNPALSRSSFLIGLAAATPLVAHASSDSSEELSKSYKSQLGIFQESVSGFAAGAAVSATKTCVKYPLDTATVRLQMPDSVYSIGNLFQLFENSYSGVIAPLLTNIPAGSVFFGVKDASKTALKDMGFGGFVSTTISVSIALIPYWALRNPSEVVKTRQQAQLEDYANLTTFEAYQKVRQDSLTQTKNNNNRNASNLGLEGFYAGYLENMLYALPADVIKFVAYDALTGGRKNLPPLQGAVAGAAATAVAQCATTPLDVVRNRIMIMDSDNSVKNDSKGANQLSSSTSANTNYVQTLIQLAKEEGFAGLFAGLTPRISKALLSGAIQFATYEETKQKIAQAFIVNNNI